jgi:hypothetical protein
MQMFVLKVEIQRGSQSLKGEVRAKVERIGGKYRF